MAGMGTDLKIVHLSFIQKPHLLPMTGGVTLKPDDFTVSVFFVLDLHKFRSHISMIEY